MSDKINVSVMGEEPVLVEKGTPLYHISESYKDKCKYPIVLAFVNNNYLELRKKLLEECEVSFVDISNANGMRVYHRSVCFLLVCAVYELFGTSVKVIVRHSIHKNNYCTLAGDGLILTKEILQNIENKMMEYVEKDIMIEKHTFALEEGVKILSSLDMNDKVNVLKYRRVSSINLYKLNGMYDYFYGPMVMSTGVLKKFKLLILPENDFILQFPKISSPNEISEFEPIKKIAHVYREAAQWSKILKINTVGGLNDEMCVNGSAEVIRTSEALHEKKIAQISDMIFKTPDRTKVVIIAGPSSSGKTTFAERLRIQLSTNGIRTRVISLDDYFIEYAPLDEDGRPDYESLEHIDIVQLNTDLRLLLEGEEVPIPSFNFKTGTREYRGNKLSIANGEILVIEGIHGLNERLTTSVPHESKFKIFISALTQLNIDYHNRIQTSDKRLIRRIVRDSKFRGINANETIISWKSVLRGESKYIYPFQENADVIFNSALVYELCILKSYVEPLLFNISKDMQSYSEAQRLIKFLDSFLAVSSEDIPSNSILREFIGGSCFRT